jgi:putative spermidine/putrescine transport system permease protein
MGGDLCVARVARRVRQHLFRRVPDVAMLPLMMFNASLAGNYQIAAITALLLPVPSIAFMLLIERFLNTEMIAEID